MRTVNVAACSKGSGCKTRRSVATPVATKAQHSRRRLFNRLEVGG